MFRSNLKKMQRPVHLLMDQSAFDSEIPVYQCTDNACRTGKDSYNCAFLYRNLSDSSFFFCWKLLFFLLALSFLFSCNSLFPFFVQNVFVFFLPPQFFSAVFDRRLNNTRQRLKYYSNFKILRQNWPKLRALTV